MILTRPARDTLGIKERLKEVLGARVISLQELHGGKTHSVFKAITTDKPLIIKIFSERKVYQTSDLPEHEKLLWIDARLKEARVPRAAVIDFAKSHPLFPNGFIVQEYVRGVMYQSLIKTRRRKEAQYYEDLGAMLRKVHSISTPAFGSLLPEKPSFKTFDAWLEDKMKSIQDISNRFAKFTDAELKSIERKFTELKNYTSGLSPVLIHTDAWPWNAMWSKEKGLVLIDWDEAQGGVWLEDLANITYTSDYIENDDPRMNAKIDAFLKSYRPGDMPVSDIKRMLGIFQIINSVKLMQYYYYHLKDEGMARHQRDDASRRLAI